MCNSARPHSGRPKLAAARQPTAQWLAAAASQLPWFRWRSGSGYFLLWPLWEQLGAAPGHRGASWCWCSIALLCIRRHCCRSSRLGEGPQGAVYLRSKQGGQTCFHVHPGNLQAHNAQQAGQLHRAGRGTGRPCAAAALKCHHNRSCYGSHRSCSPSVCPVLDAQSQRVQGAAFAHRHITVGARGVAITVQAHVVDDAAAQECSRRLMLRVEAVIDDAAGMQAAVCPCE